MTRFERMVSTLGLIGTFVLMAFLLAATIGFCGGCVEKDAIKVQSDAKAEVDMAAKLNTVIAATARVEEYTSGIKTKIDNVRQANITGRDQMINYGGVGLVLVCLAIIFRHPLTNLINRVGTGAKVAASACKHVVAGGKRRAFAWLGKPDWLGGWNL